jgi:hypothetical protein
MIVFGKVYSKTEPTYVCSNIPKIIFYQYSNSINFLLYMKIADSPSEISILSCYGMIPRASPCGYCDKENSYF